MRIHASANLPVDRILIFENAMLVADCRLDQILALDDDDADEFVDVILHPDAVEGFKQRFFPNANWRNFQ